LIFLWFSPVNGQNRGEARQIEELHQRYRRAVEENERLKQVLEATRTELRTLKHSLKHPEQALRYRQAIQRLSQAIEAQPLDAALHKNRGIAYRHLGEYLKSIQDLTRAIDLAGSDASLYNERGTAYFLHSDLNRARQDFSRAIELDVKLAEAYHNRGVIARNQGDYVQAAKDVKTAAKLGMAPAAQTSTAVKAEVTAVQRRLHQLGFAPGPLDGVPGRKTVEAIRRLQTSVGLEATGRLDIATRAALRIGRRSRAATPPEDPPRLLGKPHLEYPAIARERGWEGTVTLRIELLKNGRVGEVEVTKSSGHPSLDASALESVKRWRHQPAREHGIPVTRTISFDIEFALDQKAASPREAR